MALPDLTGQNIEDTYQRVLQTDGGALRDGTGSLVTLTNITASGNISSSGTITANSFTGNGLSIDGPSNSHIEVGEYNVGFDAVPVDTVFITGSGLIISGAMADLNHHNMLKIGNIELLDLNTALSHEFLIHNVDNFKITSGPDGAGDIANSLGRLLEHNITDFTIYKDNVQNISSTGTTTTITDGTLHISANFVQIKAPLNTSPTHYAGFDVSPIVGTPQTIKSTLASTFLNTVGGAVTSSAVSASGTIVGSNLSGTNTGDQNISNLAVTSSNVLFGDITASGNISASGNLNASSGLFERVIITGDEDGGFLDVTSGDNVVITGKFINTFDSTNSNSYAGYFQGGNAYGTPGGTEKSYGVYTLAGDTNLANPDSIALYAQSHADGAPNSYAAIFSGSGGIVGINTLEPTDALHVVGSVNIEGAITASGNISASGTIIANALEGPLTGTATGLSGTPDIIVGSLTATSITSSIVTSSIIYTEGSNIFGDAINDTQTFNGHITASGNISSSGNIIGSNLIADSASFSTRVTLNDAKVTNSDQDLSALALKTQISGSFFAPSASFSTRVTLNDAKVTNSDQSLVHLAVTSSNVLFGDITASGNISASGDIYGEEIHTNYLHPDLGSFPTSSGIDMTGANQIHLKVNGISYIRLHNNNASIGVGYIQLNSAKADIDFRVNGSNYDNLFKTDAALDYVEVSGSLRVTGTGAITASGNISASGTIVGSNLSGTNTGDQNISNLAVTSSNVLFGDITASGNISSSANIYAADYFDDGANINTIYSPIAGGTDIVTVGTIGTGTWNGDVIVEAKLENQSGTNTGDQNISNLAVTSSNVLFGDITASGDISASGTITGNSIVGTLGTAAQTNVTSLGTLSALTVSGDITANGDIVGDDTTDITNIESIFVSNLVHNGDADTKISFNTNQIGLKAGNTSVFEATITGSKLINVHQNIYNTGSLALSGNGGAIGDIVKFGGITTIAGGLYALTGSDWSLASATSTATGATSSLAVALGTNPSSDGMCLRGFVNPAVDPSAPLGNPIFLNTTVGRMVKTAPASSNNVVRIVGYQYGSDLIYFNPSNDYIIHA